MILSFILLALSLILILIGIQYPDLLIFSIGLILFLIASLQKENGSRYFGWIASFILCLALIITFINPSKDQAPSFAPAEQSIEMDYSTFEEESSVFITPYGKRYHLRPTCGGKNSKECTIKDAIAAGYTPCKKCVD